MQTGSHAKPPFLAFVSDAASRASLTQFADANHWPSSVVHEGDIHTAIAFLKDHHPSPEVLLVEIATAQEASATLDKLADVCDPNVKVIVTGTVNEYSFYCWLMDIGISSYLLKPLSAEALERALKKTSTAAHQAAQETPAAKMIAIMGTRGGAGTSTVAANLGFLISSSSKKPTALIDLDLQFGTAAMHFDLDPSRGAREALEKPDRIDGMFMDRVMVKAKEHLSLFAAEEPFEHPIAYQETAADALLKQLRDKFTYIIVDVPRDLNPFTRKFLTEADQVVAVTELSLAGLRDSMRLNDYFREGLKRNSPLFLANAAGRLGKHEMPKADFEKGLSDKIVFTIPYTDEAYAAAATGEVLAEKFKQSQVAQTYSLLARHLLPEMAARKQEEKGEKISLSALLKRKN